MIEFLTEIWEILEFSQHKLPNILAGAVLIGRINVKRIWEIYQTVFFLQSLKCYYGIGIKGLMWHIIVEILVTVENSNNQMRIYADNV